jgi:hypothetical protein
MHHPCPRQAERRFDDIGCTTSTIDERTSSVRHLVPIDACPVTAEARAETWKRVGALVLPNTLSEPCEFQEFVDAALIAIRYIDAVFACVLGRRMESGVVPDPLRDEAEADQLRNSLVVIANSFNRYWSAHAEEMLTENDLASDDASIDRMPTDVVAMSVVSLAEVTRMALGSFPDFEKMTATSTFPSVRRQLLAQSAKLICEYGPSDLMRALDALCHAWQRIRVDCDVLAYTVALRLRFAMLMRCAVVGQPNEADRAFLTEPASGDNDATPRLLTARFRQEMTHRFRALNDVSWISEQHHLWTTQDELRATIGSSDALDIRWSTRQVVCLLRDHATLVRGSGSASELYRKTYMDYLLGPGDPGVFQARNPDVRPTTQNVLKACRGGRFFAAASTMSNLEVHEILSDLADRMASGRAAEFDTVDVMNDRSEVEMHEEIAGLCAFHLFMKGRYNVPWQDRFVISRAKYRTAKELGLVDDATLPTLVIVTNRYDLLFRGQILQTSSLFESIAWWLIVIKHVYNGTLPAQIARFKGILGAKRELARGRITITACDDVSMNAEDGGGDDDDGMDDDNPLQRLTKEMKWRATTIDLRDVCDVPLCGVNAVKLQTSSIESCERLNSDMIAFS